MAEALALTLARLPASYRFSGHAFQDSGADLALQSLIDQGDHPGLDDGYLYGYLPIVAGRLWYALFGRRPLAFQAAAFLTGLVVAWGMARFARAMESGRLGAVLLILCLPSILPAGYPFLTHMIEAMLLCHALAEHARGRRPIALALLTACVFVKPSLAYVYGFLLTGLFLSGHGIESGERNGSRLLRLFLPAAVVAVVLGLGLSAMFGFGPLVHSLNPSRGMAVYRANDFGFFFGIGRDFWRPQGARLTYYLGTFTGFWLVGSLCLIAGAAVPAVDLPQRNREVARFCAVLHVAFVTLMFGNSWSWVFYSDILVLGLVALAPMVRSKFLGAIALILLALATLAQRSTLLPYASSWRTSYAARKRRASGLSLPSGRNGWRCRARSGAETRFCSRSPTEPRFSSRGSSHPPCSISRPVRRSQWS